jgi:hypothetical protein
MGLANSAPPGELVADLNVLRAAPSVATALSQSMPAHI